MFAVFKHSGKQYRAEIGSTIDIELVKFSEGDLLKFDDVVLVEKNGETVFSQGLVEAVVVRHFKAAKVLSFKKRRRHFGSKRLKGHRQNHTVVLIKSISEV